MKMFSREVITGNVTEAQLEAYASGLGTDLIPSGFFYLLINNGGRDIEICKKNTRIPLLCVSLIPHGVNVKVCVECRSDATKVDIAKFCDTDIFKGLEDILKRDTAAQPSQPEALFSSHHFYLKTPSATEFDHMIRTAYFIGSEVFRIRNTYRGVLEDSKQSVTIGTFLPQNGPTKKISEATFHLNDRGMATSVEYNVTADGKDCVKRECNTPDAIMQRIEREVFGDNLLRTEDNTARQTTATRAAQAVTQPAPARADGGAPSNRERAIADWRRGWNTTGLTDHEMLGPSRVAPQPAQPAPFNYGKNPGFSVDFRPVQLTSAQMDRFVDLFESRVLDRVSRPIRRTFRDSSDLTRRSTRTYTIRDSAGNVVATLIFVYNGICGSTTIGGMTGTGVSGKGERDLSTICNGIFDEVLGIQRAAPSRPASHQEPPAQPAPVAKATPATQIVRFEFDKIQNFTASSMTSVLETLGGLLKPDTPATIKPGKCYFGCCEYQLALFSGQVLVEGKATENDGKLVITIQPAFYSLIATPQIAASIEPLLARKVEELKKTDPGLARQADLAGRINASHQGGRPLGDTGMKRFDHTRDTIPNPGPGNRGRIPQRH